MFQEMYRAEMERVAMDGEQRARLAARMAAAPARRLRRAGRIALAVAAVCAATVVTVAAAALLGAFDFLRAQDEYAFLGQAGIYESCAYEVGQSVTAGNGDVFSVDRVAMDGRFCTVFYSVRFREPVMSPAELERIRRDDAPDVWQVWEWEPDLALWAGGAEISERAYNNSFEPQVYLADANTLYGAWRVLLSRPPAEGEALELRAAAYGAIPSGAAGEEAGWEKKWDLAVPFAARPIPSERFAPDVTFQRPIQGKNFQIQVLSLDRSPLGTLLTLREERIENYSGIEFALRDAATGAYLPYAEVFTAHAGAPEGYMDRVFEIFGDVSGLEELELVPVRGVGSVAPRASVALADLPAVDAGNPDGGYAPASYAVEDGRLIVTMKPLGAVTGGYPRRVNGVYFLDADGNQLFSNVAVQKFKNRSDGAITVVSTPDGASFRADADKVAQIGWFVDRYELLEGQTVAIPLR